MSATWCHPQGCAPRSAAIAALDISRGFDTSIHSGGGDRRLERLQHLGDLHADVEGVLLVRLRPPEAAQGLVSFQAEGEDPAAPVEAMGGEIRTPRGQARAQVRELRDEGHGLVGITQVEEQDALDHPGAHVLDDALHLRRVLAHLRQLERLRRAPLAARALDGLQLLELRRVRLRDVVDASLDVQEHRRGDLRELPEQVHDLEGKKLSSIDAMLQEHLHDLREVTLEAEDPGCPVLQCSTFAAEGLPLLGTAHAEGDGRELRRHEHPVGEEDLVLAQRVGDVAQVAVRRRPIHADEVEHAEVEPEVDRLVTQLVPAAPLRVARHLHGLGDARVPAREQRPRPMQHRVLRPPRQADNEEVAGPGHVRLEVEVVHREEHGGHGRAGAHVPLDALPEVGLPFLLVDDEACEPDELGQAAGQERHREVEES
mmetsp:Transcript_51310/g.144549  ORF Transcript_51310/g.144549 Transcript_51310/m.144549 type:complete len:428 (-) Transcript_51310:649-1932(-)